MITYPIISVDHEGFYCSSEFLVIKDGVKIVRAKNLCKLAEDVRIKLYVAEIKEYSSNTGHHRVEPLFIKPFMMTRNPSKISDIDVSDDGLRTLEDLGKQLDALEEEDREVAEEIKTAIAFAKLMS